MLTAILFLATLCAVMAVVIARDARALRGSLARAEAMLGQAGDGTPALRAASALLALVDRPVVPDHRLLHTHSVTGLPTREPLIERMSADGDGTLALLGIGDYDRLGAFNPLLAERLLLEIVARLRAMLPATRFLAQTDRTHLAVWIGPEVEHAQAESEVAALVYALGDRWIDGERAILPEIVLRSGRFDQATGPAQAFLARQLASFSVPPVADGAESLACTEAGARARERFQMEQGLRQAIDREELAMQFQPLVDASKGRVCGAEALLRWHHPGCGPIAPARFVPIMEATDLSHEIGLWALNRAAREARHWRDAGVPGLRMAVNVSGRQFEAEDLPVLVDRTLARHGLGGDALEIELTETVALAEGDRAQRLCDALRATGIRIAVDDFGTGYSSFASLRAAGFDKIKIDRAFIAEVDRRSDSQAICSSILALGRGMGIAVLAEGVETAAEYAWLRSHGCDLFQGYYFSRPLDGAAFLEFVRDTGQLFGLLQPDIVLTTERLRA